MYERMSDKTVIGTTIDSTSGKQLSLYIDTDAANVIDTESMIHRPPSPESCIICFDVAGDLVKSNTLVMSECGCSYLVHKRCLHDWMRKKEGNPACITCNTECIVIHDYEEEDRLARLEMEEEQENRHKRLCIGFFYGMVVFVILWVMIIVGAKYN